MGPQNLFLPAARTPVPCYFAAEQGLPGRQIGMGSPENAFVPAKQGLPGLHSGIGSPLNPFAAPNAVPNTTNKNPSMIFAFMCLSRPQ